MVLSEAGEREDLKVLAVNTDYRRKKHLENLSLMRGSRITCLYNRSGDVVVKIQDGRIAINREFARKIEVQSLNPEDYEMKDGKRVPTAEAQKRFSSELSEYRREEQALKAEMRKEMPERKRMLKEEKEAEKKEEKKAEEDRKNAEARH